MVWSFSTLPGAFAGPGTTAEQRTTAEYEVKATFLYNFGRFVRWPQDQWGDSTTPFLLCILGEDPFGRLIDQMVAGRSVQDRRLAVKRMNSAVEASRCHVLFISRSERANLDRILKTIDGKSVLIVSEFDDFLERGGIINFRLDRKNVRFDINVTAAESRKLKISSQLLRHAVKVVGRPQEG
ncbi:MAG TPA: YfiR family protein [Myxococcaceae bacterium]|nr:YfiR family protein [Myxococcaceae bacterium]